MHVVSYRRQVTRRKKTRRSIEADSVTKLFLRQHLMGLGGLGQTAAIEKNRSEDPKLVTMHSRKNEVGGAEGRVRRERNTGWWVECPPPEKKQKHWMQSASGVCCSGIYKVESLAEADCAQTKDVHGISVQAKATIAEVDLKPWVKVTKGKTNRLKCRLKTPTKNELKSNVDKEDISWTNTLQAQRVGRVRSTRNCALSIAHEVCGQRLPARDELCAWEVATTICIRVTLLRKSMNNCPR